MSAHTASFKGNLNPLIVPKAWYARNEVNNVYQAIHNPRSRATLSFMEMQTSIYTKKQTVKREKMEVERLESKTSPNLSSGTILDH